MSTGEQGTFVLEEYKKMIPMWVQGDFIYRCDKRNIEASLLNTLTSKKTTNVSEKLLAKAKRIKLELTKCYAIWKNERISPKSGECFPDVLEKFNGIFTKFAKK